MKDLIVMVLVMGLVLSFVCADIGIAANQGANVHRYNGTNAMIAHSGSEISNTPSGTVVATTVQAAINAIAATAATLQTATQTTITAISGLVATNVQTALAEIDAKIPTSYITLISSEVVVGDSTTSFAFAIPSPTTYKKLNLVINGTLGKSGEPASTGEVKIWLNNNHAAGDYAETSSYIETNGNLNFDSVYTTTEIVCSMAAGSNLQPHEVIDLTITQPKDSNFCASVFGTNLFSSVSGGNYFKRNKSISAGARNAGVVSSVNIFSAINFREGTQVYLYGIK